MLCPLWLGRFWSTDRSLSVLLGSLVVVIFVVPALRSCPEAALLVQIFFTTFHWTFFDAREAEYRLTTKRFYQ